MRAREPQSHRRTALLLILALSLLASTIDVQDAPNPAKFFHDPAWADDLYCGAELDDPLFSVVPSTTIHDYAPSSSGTLFVSAEPPSKPSLAVASAFHRRGPPPHLGIR